MKKLRYIFGYLVILLLISCSNEEQSTQELIRPVRYQEVTNLAKDQSRTLSGVSKAAIESNLSFKVSGTIESIKVKVGQQVRKGQLIASIDQTDYELQYEQSRAAEKSAKAQRDLAKSSYHRIETLYENGNVSLSEYEQSKTTYESAKEQVKQIDKQTDQLRKQISYTKLYAPMDGIVGQVLAERNENVSQGQTIVEFNSGSDLEVVVGMPEAYISRISVNEEVKIQFPSQPDLHYEGTITEVSYSSGQQSSTYPVTVKISNSDEFLRPGMTADVSFKIHGGILENAIFVPIVSVAHEEGSNYIFVLKRLSGDTAIVNKQKIEVGKITDNGFEVLAGINEGQFVVTAGVSKLTDGMKVKVLDGEIN